MNSEIVDIQIKAFNDKNLSTFLNCYSDEIVVSMLETGDILTSGKEELRKAMQASFETKPKATTVVMERILQKDLVINLEKILHYLENKIVKVVSVYEVKEDKITRLWFSNRTISET